MKSFRPLPSFLAITFLAFAGVAAADDGDPIALRRWSDGTFTVETMWNLKVGVGSVDKQTTGNNGEVSGRGKVDFHADQLSVNESGTLSRGFNQPRPTWTGSDEPDQDDTENLLDSDLDGDGFPDLFPPPHNSTNDVSVSRHSVLPSGDATADSICSVNVDTADVIILFLNDLTPELVQLLLKREDIAEAQAPEWLGHIAVVATSEAFDSNLLAAIAKSLRPETLVVGSHIKTVAEQPVTRVPHNTVAISAPSKKISDPGDVKTRFVSLGDQPYELSPELAKLFAAKEAASQRTQKLFAGLSVEQMNFRPDNGTHTPRWNAEHMMGRELLFFSQIFHAMEPRIREMNLNPKQMPDDYEFAHPDWTGAEEARQTQRVEAFTRRFAYLLDGMDLDQKAKGSRFWTPRGLLAQMERHYDEHTANVRKKMELPEWPESRLATPAAAK